MASALENGEVSPEALAQALREIEDLRALIEEERKKCAGYVLENRKLKADNEQSYLDRVERDDAEVLVKVWRKGTKRRRRLDNGDWLTVMNAVKDHGFGICLRAIAGAVYDPASTRRRNGTLKLHNDISLILRNAQKVHDFADRAPKGWKPDAQKLAEIGGVSEEWVRARVSVRPVA